MNWHARYQQQAGWTAALRAYLFAGAGLERANQALEVGCGTGAVLGEMSSPIRLHGLDLSIDVLNEAKVHASRARLVCGDAHHLPYPGATFDLTCCHYLLLWVHDPLQVVREMKRVTRRGGHVLALAEPDYTARRDAPAALVKLGLLQTQALRDQGADPGLGSRLADLFHRAGLELLETGAMPPPPPAPFDRAAWELEWTVLRSDLDGRLPDAQLQRYQELDLRAWERGERLLHIPTYFAWGLA